MMHGFLIKNGPACEKRTILYNGQKPCPQRVRYSETPLYIPVFLAQFFFYPYQVAVVLWNYY